MNARVQHLLLAMMLASAPAAAAQQPDAPAKSAAADDESKEAGWMALARHWFESEDTVPRFTIVFGGIKPGSGAAGGPAVGHTFADGSFVQATAEYSIHNYKLAQARFQSRPFGKFRGVFSSRARWQDAPSVALYERGADAPERRALFAERKTEFSAQLMLRPTAITLVGGGIGYEKYRVGGGRTDPHEDESLPQVPDLPGLGTRPTFVHSFAAAGIDARPSGDVSRRGWRANAAAHHYTDRGGPLSFSQVVAEGERLFPVASERGALSFVGNFWASSGTTVPFFLMPTLGGGDFLRGYRTYRFRDRDALVLTAQVQWRVHEYADAAVFVDAGSVAPRVSALSLRAIPLTEGIGIRVHTPKRTIFRMDLARSVEGFQLLIGFSSRASAVF
jgi:hypothetical protein